MIENSRHPMPRARVIPALLLVISATIPSAWGFPTGRPPAPPPRASAPSSSSSSSILRTLLIDNYDSYTYNLAHYLAEVNEGIPPLVVYNDECQGDWRRLQSKYGTFDNIVISPGPGSPERPADFGLSRFALNEIDTPVLGICLGHQGLGYVHGGRVIRAATPMHGRLARIKHTSQGIFEGIPQDFIAVRYHSLIVEPPPSSSKQHPWALEETAWTSDGILMGLQHRSLPHYGVQFHPESIGTQHGHTILQNFRDITLNRRRNGRIKGDRGGSKEGEKGSKAFLYIENNPTSAFSSTASPKPSYSSSSASSSSLSSEQQSKGTHQVFIRRLGMIPEGLIAQDIFQTLYEGKSTSFWLDSSATQRSLTSTSAVLEGAIEGQVPAANGGRFSFMGDAESGGSLAHVLEYYMANNKEGQQGSMNRLKMVKKGGQEEETLEGEGGTLFTFLKQKLGQIREGGVDVSIVEDFNNNNNNNDVATSPSSTPKTRRLTSPIDELGGLEFWGGYVGYLGYELKDDCLRLQRGQKDDDAANDVDKQRTEKERGGGEGVKGQEGKCIPDALLIFADRIIAFDHVRGTLDLIAVAASGQEVKEAEGEKQDRLALRWLEETEAKIRSLASSNISKHHHQQQQEQVVPIIDKEGEDTILSLLNFKPLVTPAEYMSRVDKCLNLIAAGESYEVCLTGQLSAPIDPEHGLDPFRLYKRLRKRNPAPYSAFIRHDPTNRLIESAATSMSEKKGAASNNNQPAVAVCCSSPERFLRVTRGVQSIIESKPIKGTVRRGATSTEDKVLAANLANCEKNRAENLMIADLVRNDISRIARPGSVQVPKLMAVETYATVHQLVSTVQGTLEEGKDAIDAVVASFPGGSMTGAPKKRTMEIIDRLEGHQPRGPYSGALGYIALDGLAIDLNIIIRTAVMSPGQVTIGAGGAIVALSERQTEYDEMILKARAVAGALGGKRSLVTTTEEEEEREEGDRVMMMRREVEQEPVRRQQVIKAWEVVGKGGSR